MDKEDTDEDDTVEQHMDKGVPTVADLSLRRGGASEDEESETLSS